MGFAIMIAAPSKFYPPPSPPLMVAHHTGVARLRKGGFTVCIGNGDCHNDRILPGYCHGPQKLLSDPRVHGRECTIPSTPEKEFCVHVAYKHSRGGSRVAGAGFRVAVLADNAWLTDAFWPAANLKQRKREIEITSYPGASGGKCSLRFIRREFAEKNPSEAEEPGVEWLSTISVLVYWAFEEPPPTVDEEEEEVKNILCDLECVDVLTNPLDERKAAIYSTGVEYAPEKEQAIEEPETKYWTQPANNQDYWFIFHHRHPAWLVAKGIAPRSILPTKPESTKSPTSTLVIKSEEREPLPLRSRTKRKGCDTPPSSKKPTRASKRTRRN
ncbi:hypothetical protein FRC08_005078 [Ceratobasidium sp. 394]|nr:hypothetical protein FRC08_005078 [Ceratobasidium sp. 394]